MKVDLLAAVPSRRHSVVVDALVPVLLALLFIVVPLILPADLESPDGRRGPDLALTGPDIVLTAVSAGALLLRRARPLPALLITGVTAAVAIVGGWQVNLAQLAVAVALYAYGVGSPRARTVIAAVVAAASLGGLSVLMVVLGLAEWGRQDIVLWLCTAAAVAIAVHSRRAAITALEDRANRAEESREATALRRVAEDRVRIARELHDVIAHHVAVISVQAGAAEHVIERDPSAAREALGHVRASAKSVLAELQSVLGVLRQDETAQPTAPAPGMSGIDDLVRSFRSIGLPIDVVAPEQLPELPPTADLAAFRLVQEALTNVQKHARGAATVVSIGSSAGALQLIVTNRPAPPAEQAEAERLPAETPTGSGLGLTGMRERVVAADGTLETGPTADGGFRVAARLPVRWESS